MDETYDTSKLIEFKPIPLWLKWYYRLNVPIMLPIIMVKEAFRKIDRNILHDGKRTLTGKKKLAYSDPIDFANIKATSKTLKVTINELLTASLSVALK